MSIKRVGIIGGGQLAWMMADAARKLQLELVIQTPSPQDPAVSIANRVILADVDDAKATANLASHCDVITFENEFVDLVALSALSAQGICFRPSINSLSSLLDKYHQLTYLQQIGLPVPGFISGGAVESPFGFPVVLKVCRHGYDGQGTFTIQDKTSLEEACQRFENIEFLLQEFIPFERELAVICARSLDGEMVVYPVVETQQAKQVCRRVFAPASVTPEIELQVEFIAKKILTQLQYVGVLGIELFLTTQGKILINEIAPRTHNSGHYTLDACTTSQFEMLLRSVTGLPLTSPQLKSAGAIMVNLLGYEQSYSDYQEKRSRLAAIPNAYLHWYGKNQSRVGRKLGHVTLLLTKEELSFAQDKAKEIEGIWYLH